MKRRTHTTLHWYFRSLDEVTCDRLRGTRVLSNTQGDKARFEHAIVLLKAELANIAGHVNNEVAVRHAYQVGIQNFVHDLRAKAQAGAISWGEAAQQANLTRNAIMESMRVRSTPVGRAIAESMKKEGKTLNALIAKKTIDVFGTNAKFPTLTGAQQNKVYEQVIISAAKSNPGVDRVMRVLRPTGRVLLFISVAVSLYAVWTADDKVSAAKKEGATLGAGILGGVAGGAAAGLLCGPGAPVCVALGAFVGGALAAFGVSTFW
jgi:hypothetical protein